MKGLGSFADKNTIDVTDNEGKTQQITAKNFIIATGSDVSSFPGL